MSLPSPKQISVSVVEGDSLDVVVVRVLSRLKTGDELLIKISDSKYHDTWSNLRILERLTSVAKRYEFERLNTSTDKTDVIAYRYLGAELPTDLILDFSFNHINSVRDLFQDVFEQNLSHRFWRWKYEHGKPVFSPVLIENGQVIAHYGGIPRDIQFMSSKFTGVQACDVMVKKSNRGKLTSSNMALLIAFGLKQFDISSSSVEKGSPTCFFGFPHGRHLLLGQRLMEYKNLGYLYDVFITPQSFARAEINSSHSLKSLLIKSDLKNSWDKAWLAMQKDTQKVVMGVRDWVYGHKRYIGHPEFSYFYYTDAEDENIVLVVRKIEGSSYKLLDYIGPLDKLADYVASLYSHLKSEDSKSRLHLWQLETFANQLSTIADIVRTKAALSVKLIGDAVALERKQWWISMGDTDFL